MPLQFGIHILNKILTKLKKSKGVLQGTSQAVTLDLPVSPPCFKPRMAHSSDQKARSKINPFLQNSSRLCQHLSTRLPPTIHKIISPSSYARISDTPFELRLPFIFLLPRIIRTWNSLPAEIVSQPS